MTNVLIELTGDCWPTCFISKNKAASVKVKVDKDQLAEWKADIKAYHETQKEMLDLVNTYEPARFEAARTKQIQGLVKKAKSNKSSTE